MKKFALATTVVGAAVLGLASSAFAVSCSQQGAECRGWAAGQGAQASMYAGKCNTEVKTCINRCKGGNKVFIGVQQGVHYPISDCK